MLNLSVIEHIFFDLDHTLWDFDQNSKLAYAHIFKTNSIEMDLEAFAQVYEPINLKYWRLYRNEDIDKAGLRYGRLKDTFDAISLDIPDALIDILAIEYIEQLPNNNYLFPGVFPLLNMLEKKYTLHIITNGFEEVQTKKLINSNLEQYFQVIMTSESAGCKKPNPIIFNKSLEEAGAMPSNSLMIGDSYEADVEGARAAGLQAIWFNYKDQISTENMQVSNLHDLKQLLES